MSTVSATRGRLPYRWRPLLSGGENSGLRIGLLILALLVLIGVLGPFFLPDPNATAEGRSLLPPSSEHWFGTDRYGRDVLARTVKAIQLDLMLGAGVAAAAMIFGSLLGALAGYLGGIIDEVVMRLTDALLAFPSFVLALMIVAFTGNNLLFLAIGVTVGSMPHFVRLSRARALSERELDYIAASTIAGSNRRQIIFGHVMPNTISAPLIQTTVTAGWAILDIAALSFLGVGVQPPTAEWGTMIFEGYREILTGSWWPAFFPGLFLFAAVLGFQLVGDGLSRWNRA